MSLIFSRRCDYALQAVLYLALKRPDELTPAKELAAKLDLPTHFLSKILHDLARKGLLRSLKGPSGGFALGMSAKDITLSHVVAAIDGLDLSQGCVLGFSECSGSNPCAVHDNWAGVRENLHFVLFGKNIEQLAGDMKKPGYRSVTNMMTQSNIPFHETDQRG